MSRLTRDGKAEPVSRDQILRHARGRVNIIFPCSADHEQDWQPYPVDPYSAIYDDYTYIHTYMYICVTAAVRMYICIAITYSRGEDQPGKVANPARGQLADQGKLILPCLRSRLKIWSRETGSAVPPRVSLLISIPRLDHLVLTCGIPLEFRGGVHILSVHIM